MSSSATPPAVSITGLYKDYGDRRVLNGIDLQVEWGEIAALFGANGAGKTTLLRILAGLTRPDAGLLHIGPYSLRRQASAARRSIGFLSHDTMLYPDLTCRENLLFYARLYSLPDPLPRIDLLLEQVGLDDRRNRRARTLSHGMQRRLALARAILHDPPLLLMDEPDSGMDRRSLAALRQLLTDWAQAGRAALFTTHNEPLGLAWSHRALALSRGRLVAHSAAPENL